MVAPVFVYYCEPPISDYLVLRCKKGQQCKLQGLTEDTMLILTKYKRNEVFAVCNLRLWSDSCVKVIESTDKGVVYHIGIRDLLPRGAIKPNECAYRKWANILNHHYRITCFKKYCKFVIDASEQIPV